MSTLLNPESTVAYDAAAGLVVVVFRAGEAQALVELDPDAVPGLINELMEARRQSKAARKPSPLPPPLPSPAPCPPAARPTVPTPADHKRIRLQDRLERARR